MIANELQALVVGVLMGALAKAEEDIGLRVHVEAQYDADRNYEPWFLVTGDETGTRLRVHVEAVDQ